jgi:hypothetical protein
VCVPPARPTEEEGSPLTTSQKVVAHFRNRKVLKGYTHSFSPSRPDFQMITSDHKTVPVHRDQLKAVFFVKSLIGNRLRVDVRDFLAGPLENAQGVKIAVRFGDGEWVCGYTVSYSPARKGFFLFPADPGSNNLRIFVVAEAAEEVRIGKEAEVLARRFRTRAA